MMEKTDRKIQIRYATPADTNAVYAFICALEEQTFDKTVFENCFRNNLLFPDVLYLVAAGEDGILSGFISAHGQVLLHHLGMVYEIQELFVTEQHRNLGIGQQLIAALKKILNEKGHRLLEVSSNKRRTDTHRFYTRCGFTASHYKFTKEL